MTNEIAEHTIKNHYVIQVQNDHLDFIPLATDVSEQCRLLGLHNKTREQV